MWDGMNVESGRAMDSIDHLRQSITKILTTPVGTRVMRRDFGSLLPDLVDQPINPATRLRVMAATATAIVKWERRIRVSRVDLALDGAGLTVDLHGTLRIGARAGEPVDLSIPLTRNRS